MATFCWPVVGSRKHSLFSVYAARMRSTQFQRLISVSLTRVESGSSLRPVYHFSSSLTRRRVGHMISLSIGRVWVEYKITPVPEIRR
ncbi:hypothetical protein M514_01228 [Trichuris suis]|uniref:Uncharacterized protein n=1 Tax=Trichuris suis TaxID=68888 RepID=A0A085NMX5_9BILA|nr:hypothetical protein M513_01228 [Trichuris suis]KFD70821.1 hypothetical protein M514_01228 [Trichuris suis]